MSEEGATEKVVNKATEKVCIERWQWTLAKVIAFMTIVSAIAHVGEAIGEIVKLWP